MKIFQNFDVNERADDGMEKTDFEPMPDGHYRVVCEKAEETVTSTTQTEAAKFEWTVSEGPHKGRKLWDTLHLEHPKIGARDQNKFRDICKATNNITPTSLNDFPGSDCVVDIKVKPASDDGRYAASNEIKRYLPPVPKDSETPVQSAPKRAGNSEWQAP
jgi:hypothetical protein